jgi:hypothetical protein
MASSRAENQFTSLQSKDFLVQRLVLLFFLGDSNNIFLFTAAAGGRFIRLLLAFHQPPSQLGPAVARGAFFILNNEPGSWLGDRALLALALRTDDETRNGASRWHCREK